VSDKARFLAAPVTEPDIPFPRPEYQGRWDRTRARMAALGIDLLWVSDPSHMCWLTGYRAEWYMDSGPDPWEAWAGIALHVDHDAPVHFDIEDEAKLIALTSAVPEVKTCPIEAEGRAFAIAELAARGWLKGSVGLETARYRPSRAVSEAFQAGLEAAGARVVDGSAVIRPLRWLKSPAELAAVREAARIADIGMAAALATVRAGVSELDVYAEMTHAMHRAGGEPAAIPLPVTSGPRAGSGHALASRRVIRPGEVVNIDICGVRHRYHTNLSRMAYTGDPPAALADRVGRALAVQGAARAALRPGLPARELVAVLEAAARAEGIWDERWWLGGYELGVAMAPDWVGGRYYEAPGDPGDLTFEPGAVANLETIFYLPEAAGITMLIDTIVAEEARCGLVHATPAALHPC
jgi:Xaa-Pro aminopeptidase